MIDLLSCVDNIKDKHGIDNPDFNADISRFFIGNKWFGTAPVSKDGRILIDERYIRKIESKIEAFCDNYGRDDSSKLDFILGRFKNELPKTAWFFVRYIRYAKLEDSVSWMLADFLVFNMVGELPETDDREIGDILEQVHDKLPKSYGDILVDFINWVKTKTKTVYQNIYVMNNYADKGTDSEAYDIDRYLNLLYYLFNEDYAEANDMYVSAAQSKNFTDTWLFLALHYVCALRNTDLLRIPHPRLIATPEETLRQIESGEFSNEDAVVVLNSVVWHLEALLLTPNKTAGVSGVSSIKFFVPETIQPHMGTLFALAEAHFKLSGAPDGSPLVRVIQSYEQINRYMGEDIGDLFLEANFHSRSANKSFMQMIELLTDDVLGGNDEFKVKGYILAALARSHKGSYGDFAKTTRVYLSDAKMSGCTPEFVAREMSERGVMSFAPSMLLKMVTGNKYDKMSVEGQTKLIKELNMSPGDVDKAVALMQSNMKRSIAIVNNIYNSTSKEEILQILHRIGNGEAVSKCDGCMCILSAMKKPCPFLDNSNCVSCEYEISTKTTMFLMVQEYKRLKQLYASTENAFDKQRCKALVFDVLAPKMTEVLSVVEERYGKEGLEALERIVSEG